MKVYIVYDRWKSHNRVVKVYKKSKKAKRYCRKYNDRFTSHKAVVKIFKVN